MDELAQDIICKLSSPISYRLNADERRLIVWVLQMLAYDERHPLMETAWRHKMAPLPTIMNGCNNGCQGRNGSAAAEE